MDAKTHERLLADTTRLRHLLSNASTRAVTGYCLTYNLRRRHEPNQQHELSSPSRQIAFLLGLLLSTPSPSAPDSFGDKQWQKCVDLLERIFQAYAVVMWPTAEEVGSLSKDWRDIREVAGQALLYYHNTGLLATIDQVRDRITDYLTPFDEVLASRWGLGASDALAICDYIFASWQDREDTLGRLVEEERRQRLDLINAWEAEGLDRYALRQRASDSGYKQNVTELFDLMDQLGTIHRDDIVGQFHTAGEAFWRQFSVERGTVSLTYLTEQNPADVRPLLLLDSGSAAAPSVNALFQAVLIEGERTLEESESAERYRRRRDRVLEDQVEVAARRLLGSDASYFRGLYDTADQQGEHDLVVVAGGHVVVFEAKASPPKEPFRDPERGYIRLKRAFRSDTGIQKAYEQADRIRAALATGAPVELYNERGAVALQLDPVTITAVQMVCVTRDDWGPVAVDLALLLERTAPGAPYPWATNILNMQAIARAWEYLNLTPSDFLRYLGERVQLHGRILCWDELDLAGFWLRHGGFHWILDSRADKFHIVPTYSEIFDDIHAAVHLDGPAVTLEVSPPYIANTREMLAGMLAQLAAAGRNDPCPCGSGKKFKKCHGRAS